MGNDKKVVRVITNSKIGDLINRPLVAGLVSEYAMNWQTVSSGPDEGASLIIYKGNTFIEISELLVDNYVDIAVVNAREMRQVTGGTVLHAAISMGSLDPTSLRRMQEKDHAFPDAIFLSYNEEKTAMFNQEILALQLLYSAISSNGLLALETCTFDKRLKEKILTSGVNPFSLEKYRAIASKDDIEGVT